MKRKLVLFTICTALLFTGCSAGKLAKTVKDVTDSATSSKETPEPTPAGTPEPKVTKLALGKKGTIGDWKVCVKKADIKTQIKNGSYRYFEPSKGNKFVLLTMTVKNNGKKEEEFLPRVGYEDTLIMATLCYKDDYEYKPTELLSYDKDLTTKKITPLTTKKGVIAFEVPKNVAKAKKKLTVKIGTTKDYLVYQLK